MQWTRTDTLALAQQSCTQCHGLGLKPTRTGASTPCACVFRAIFRACYRKFRECADKEKYVSRVSLEANRGAQRKNIFGLKGEEFMADFCLVSRRVLSDAEYQIFKFHFLLGADWKLCCRRLNMDRGTFYHEVYRIQERLGRVFRELEPYALFPVDEYFNGVKTTMQPVAAGFHVESEDSTPGSLLKFPVKKAA
jgi:hypothetical protein